MAGFYSLSGVKKVYALFDFSELIVRDAKIVIDIPGVVGILRGAIEFLDCAREFALSEPKDAQLHWKSG